MCKKVQTILLISFLLHFSSSMSFAATGLEFYSGLATAESSTSSTTYKNYLTVTADRSLECGSKDFYIIAHVATSVDNTNATTKVRLVVDGSVEEEVSGLNYFQTDVDRQGFVYNFVKKVTLSNTSQDIELDFGSANGAGGTVNAENATILVLEKSANAEDVTLGSDFSTGSNTAYQTVQTLSFTDVGGDYLVAFSGKVKTEDESDTDVEGMRVRQSVGGGSVSFAEGYTDWNNTANDDVFYTVGGVWAGDCGASGGTCTFLMEAGGEGTSDEYHVSSGATLIAIPLSDFENTAATDSQSTKTFHRGTPWTDSNVNQSVTVTTGNDYISLVGYEVGDEAASSSGSARLISAGTTFEAHTTDGRDEDTDGYFLHFLVDAFNPGSSPQTVELEGSAETSLGTGEGAINDAHLMVLEVPSYTTPVCGASRRIMIVQ